MKPTLRHRLIAACWCLRGRSVVFNITMETDPTRIISRPMLISNSRFRGPVSLGDIFE